jgi:divalent metal cation (Fe/Co/Zn/Cd) transporter
MDPEPPAALRRIISENAHGAIEAHDVRTRTAGSVTFVEFHLVVPRRMAVEDAHKICDCVEHALRKNLGSAVINIHVGPERKAKHSRVVVL